jgi:hypothetical protein
LFRDDNATVYHYLEEATRSTMYAASIQPFQRSKNGRAAWMALKDQYAGIDKYDKEIKAQEQLLHTRVWKGQSNFSLEAFITQHRNAFVSLQACAEHQALQLPNEHSRVGFLINAIQNSDPELQAALAQIKLETGPNGMRSNFEAAATYLLSTDTVARKRDANCNKRGAAQISAVEVDAMELDEDHATISDTQGGKVGIGKTGVHLRFHSNQDYKELSKEQQQELREWRAAKYPNGVPNHLRVKAKRGQQPKKGSPKKGRASYSKKQIASMVAKQVKAQMKQKSKDAADHEDAAAYISALMNRAKISTVETAAIPQPPPALNSILKRAKQGQVSAVETAIDVDMEAEEQPSPKPAPTLNQIIKRARFVGLNGKK